MSAQVKARDRGMQTRAAARWVDRAIIAVMLLLGLFMLLPFAWR
jgi:multiple sugar transport system permease protein